MPNMEELRKKMAEKLEKLRAEMPKNIQNLPM
jgi:hypothetical protein